MSAAALPVNGTAHADSHHMPVAGYLAIMLGALAIALGAAWVGREYALDNLDVLNLPERIKNVRIDAINVLFVAGLALFLFAATVPRQKFQVLRWKLLALGFGIWAFGCFHTYQARISITKLGASTATVTAGNADALRAAIKSKRATAEGLRQSAARQATSILSTSRADGSASLRQAIETDKQADAMDAQLVLVERGKAPTEAEVWKDWTEIKMAAESLLIGLIEFVMMMLAGEMVRAARDAYATQKGALPAAAPAPPQPEIKPVSGAVDMKKIMPTWRMPVPNESKIYGAGVLSLAGLAEKQEAPAVPPDPEITISAPAPLRKAPPAPTIDAPAETDAPVIGASKQTHQKPESASKQTHPKAAKADAPKAKRVHKSTAVAGGRKLDTGTGEHDGHRYRRVRAAVEARTLTPGLRPIQLAEGGGAPVVRGYLAAMHAEGLIEPRKGGKGWVPVAKAPKA